MRQLLIVLSLFAFAGCATNGASQNVRNQIATELDDAVKASTQTEVYDALLPPMPAPTAPVDSAASEAKFDLAVNNTPAQQVFMAIVSGTRYSMLLHPDIEGNISLNLKDVTVFDALESIREMYGYEYKIDGTRIYIQPLGLQTRIFHVNYLTGQREGKSSLRVSSGSVSDNPSSSSTRRCSLWYCPKRQGPGALPMKKATFWRSNPSRIAILTMSPVVMMHG